MTGPSRPLPEKKTDHGTLMLETGLRSVLRRTEPERTLVDASDVGRSESSNKCLAAALVGNGPESDTMGLLDSNPSTRNGKPSSDRTTSLVDLGGEDDDR